MYVVGVVLTLWFQLEDMFQLIVTPQGNQKVTIQLKDTPTKVYAIANDRSLSLTLDGDGGIAAPKKYCP